MGSYYWYTSDTNRAIRSYHPFPVYLLRPDGKPLLEKRYAGFGEFGGCDIYGMVADWNREYLAAHPEFLIFLEELKWSKKLGTYLPMKIKRVDEFEWYSAYSDLSKTPQEVEQEIRKSGWDSFEYYYIGMDIAGSDIQNIMIPYSIKLVEKVVPYEDAAPSKLCLGKETTGHRFWKKNDDFGDMKAYASNEWDWKSFFDFKHWGVK